MSRAMNISDDSSRQERPFPFQFGIRTLLMVTTALAVLLGVLKWAGAPAGVIALVMGMIGLGLLFAVLLVVSLANPREPDHPNHDDTEVRR